MLAFLGLLCIVATIFFIIAAAISAIRKTNKGKKRLLWASWSFFLFLIFFAFAIEDDPEVEKTSVSTAEKTQAGESREDEIEETINSIIDENYSHTTVSDMEVDENLGLNDGSYIVLPYLKFDAMNNEKRTKNLIEMYSEDLAANLAKEEDISELTVFWEAPYLLEGQNIAKFTFTRKGENMIIGESWYDSSLR
ncbi:hypothetical protein [Bacillus sp. mrc49]|uniref:hypothetical protein n=1 Tax=Bacillus sp. mrc49 TaxID=2054913 RepID=UPI000C278771|nr:hypothetical protein [Bacillus sp. mrc49]PJN91310.1 hypothetical protein CVN76_05650 [Bacillus sp. mrc49]